MFLNMGKKIIWFFILVLVYGVITKNASAANFINAFDAISNSRLSQASDEAQLNIQSSNHNINLTTSTPVAGGSIRILISAKDNTEDSNDVRPDSGDSIASSGFDLNGLSSSDIACEFSGSGEPKVVPSSESIFEEHEIICPFTGKIDAGTSLAIRVGSEEKGLINPIATSSHVKGKADIYPLAVHLLDAGGNIVDRIILKVALIDEIRVCTGEVCVGAQVGKYRFRLFGLTSPNALLTLEGQTISDKTVADANGNFEFTKPSPLFAQEVCLITRDSQRRISPPVCIPPFPVNLDTNIGPVLMPPTLSPSRGEYTVGDQASLAGETIPNTKVDLSVFRDKRQFFSLIKQAEAYGLPKLEIKADSSGKFSTSLPTTQADNFNFFTQANYNKFPSPKSFTLSINVFPTWYSLIKVPLQILSLLRNRCLEILLFWIILIIFVLIIRRFLHPDRIVLLHPSGALMIRPHDEIIVWSNNRAVTEKSGGLSEAK